mmetsp:Transcript_4298/g.4924  ORF Transcript_4298/g.4924 Transcript_4298/m.4924 type:complete len:431 (-) Transcript_4298:89-1381(-)|eukprot:CAMPEP_0204645824 /NCGR_PEP_ID=MMETSP0718-20130828/3577_1 /ASSEMBLY_ACC=CAM_ASM_000674 /TAXON_ID=230516 /ORGANISM="Chaetoceros curvisetus" /LENGTH=430 /DNA_ID=CAMNT_0051667889 /DNA_START=69 /DNA_END=1361 /DNA_ORIENTATION=+
MTISSAIPSVAPTPTLSLSLGLHDIIPAPPGYWTIFQVVNGLISAVCSSIIALANLGEEGLSSPFRRIIFGLSISDILQSLSLVFGPMSVPRKVIKLFPDTGYFVYETSSSCRANGFVLQVSMLAVIIYVFHLSLYYLCKLKYRMTDDTFKYKIERKMHALIAIISLPVGISGLVLDLYHLNIPYFSFCSFSCWDCFFDDRRATLVSQYLLVTEIIITPIFLCMIIIIMGLLCHHAFVMHRNVKKELHPTSLRRRPRKTEDAPPAIEDETNEDIIQGGEETVTPQDRLQNLSQLYLRENFAQAVSYVLVLLLTHFLYALTGFIFHTPLDPIAIFFLPLGGFLNILVYTRPMIAGIRRSHPECSRMRGFWMVLKAGGKIPDDIDLSASCCQSCCGPTAMNESEYDYTASANREGEPARSTSLWTKLSRAGF